MDQIGIGLRARMQLPARALHKQAAHKKKHYAPHHILLVMFLAAHGLDWEEAGEVAREVSGESGKHKFRLPVTSSSSNCKNSVSFEEASCEMVSPVRPTSSEASGEELAARVALALTVRMPAEHGVCSRESIFLEVDAFCWVAVCAEGSGVDNRVLGASCSICWMSCSAASSARPCSSRASCTTSSSVSGSSNPSRSKRGCIVVLGFSPKSFIMASSIDHALDLPPSATSTGDATSDRGSPPHSLSSSSSASWSQTAPAPQHLAAANC
mmetsp:Transcript_62700/g.149659  ORF Transcript_62700/g.149659 Transcript_62700/m.149659 type:complete len:268 (-) Transcript_62700:777-1580(-)